MNILVFIKPAHLAFSVIFITPSFLLYLLVGLLQQEELPFFPLFISMDSRIFNLFNEFLFGVMKIFYNYIVCWLHNCISTLETIGQCTSDGHIVMVYELNQ